MTSPSSFLTLTEAKNKELVPVIRGVPLHSLHNPRREAEVFANNHLAHLSKASNVLVLGLGFGYHLEEMAKILRLRHKEGKIVVLEAHKELVRLWQSYQKNTSRSQIYSEDIETLYCNQDFCQFLLTKPIVIIHHPSFDSAREYYQAFLTRRASNRLNQLKTEDESWNSWIAQQGTKTIQDTLTDPSQQAAWIRAYWELKHAD